MSKPLRVDALVIGGSVQGLLIADRLRNAGNSCLVVTAADLGAGQTLHSHGVLNAGFGLAGAAPVRLLQEVVLPDLKRRGVHSYGRWFAGEQPLPEVNVDRQDLVTALARGNEGRVVRGTLGAVRRADDGRVQAVEIAAHGFEVEPGVVIVAAGTGSKSLLRQLGAGEPQVERIKHRVVHVLCVRGSSSALAALDLVSPADLIFVASHERDGVRTYLATPMQFAAPHVEDAPPEATAEIDLEFAVRGWETLFRLRPTLGATPGLEFATYAGLRQDYGDMPGQLRCERVEGAPNVIAALPGGLLGAWPVASRATALAGEAGVGRTPQPELPDGLAGVPVGQPYEEASVRWEETPPG